MPHPRRLIATTLLSLSMIAATTLSPSAVDDPFLRHAAPLAAEPAGNPTSTTIVLDMSNIADSPALMQWAGDAGKVCAEW